MSLELIEKEIRRFLNSEEPEVLCIKGKWGVGKTYTWRRCFEEASKNNDIGLKNYSYVSLFGIKSLFDLKYTCFSNTVPCSTSSGSADPDSYVNMINSLKKAGKGTIPFISGGLSYFKLGGLSAPLLNASFMMVRDQIVCFDDLERRSNGLEVVELLGLASLLKEERNCKVVLLLNDQELEENDQVVFENHLEKVVDKSFRFEITSEEALTLGLSENSELTDKIRPLISKLGVSNIRVIRKICRNAKQISEILSGQKTSIVDQAISTTVLASWAVNEPKRGPSVEFLRDFNTLSMFTKLHDNALSDEETKWRQLLDNYGYAQTDDFDNAIISGIETGYFATEEIEGYATVISQRQDNKQTTYEFSAAWQDLYHGSLAVDDDEVLRALYNSAVKEAEYISLQNINSTVIFLKSYGYNDEARALIDSYISAHSHENYEFFDIEENHFLSAKNVDPELLRALETERENYRDDRTPYDVVCGVADSGNWEKTELFLLSKVTVDQFIGIFEKLSGKQLRNAIKYVVAMGNEPGENAATIKETVKSALQTIAEKSPLRLKRLQSWGAPVEDPNRQEE